MTAITALQKRLDRLEERPSTEPDLVEIVLATLDDADLEVLQEASELNAAGYNAAEISSMMGERWLAYEVAAAHFREVYQKTLIEHTKGFRLVVHREVV
jgi:hypothetical protein